MRFLALILLLLLSFTSCKSSKLATKNKSVSKTGTPNSKLPKDLKAENIVTYAEQFIGVRYKYGGITKKGMDCSGLIYVSYKNENINLPRISRDMATKGISISLKDVKKGDLLFFQTNKNKRVINHVGLVTESIDYNIKFIHSTSSKGVITSSLSESYWQSSFKEARRFL